MELVSPAVNFCYGDCVEEVRYVFIQLAAATQAVAAQVFGI